MQNHEKIKSALLHMREIEQIKVAVLGECYSNLGNNVWQILSEIHLHTIEGKAFSGRDLAKMMILPESLTKRLINLLGVEGLIELSKKSESELDGLLTLSELGISKVTQIIVESANEPADEINPADKNVFFAHS